MAIQAVLGEILEVCKRYDACVILDDAHGTGTLGVHGRGILEAHGLEGTFPMEKLVVVSTFSKTFGGIGGLILGDEEVVDHIKHRARSFLFSATLPVPIVAAAATILDMLEADGPALVAELHQKAEYMRSSLKQLGFDLGHSNTHIMPVMCRDERKALFMHVALMENGVMMVPITYPGVKQGVAHATRRASEPLQVVHQRAPDAKRRRGSSVTRSSTYISIPTNVFS